MASRSPFLALLTGDKLRAADLYYQEGRLEKAAELYAKAGNLRQAAKVSVELGNFDHAVALYQQAGAPQQAAEVLVSAGRHKDAIPLFDSAGAFWPAAEASNAIGQPARAARYYEKARAYEQAARAFEKAAMLEDAVRLLELEIRRLESGGATGRDASMRETLRGLRMRRIDLLVKCGRSAAAAAALVELGQPAQAAAMFEKAKAWREALEAYLTAGDAASALRLLDRVPDLPAGRRAEILVRNAAWAEAAPLLMANGQIGEAAEAYENAENFAAAAPLWQQALETQRAAECYLRAGFSAEAARCYAAGGQQQAAADAFAKSGAHREAADLYAQLGQSLRAATHYLEAGDRERAMNALQNVEPGGVTFERATLLLVPLLVEDGLAEAALHRLQMLPGDRATGLALFDRMYWEGRVLEALGRLAEARDSYQKLLALRRDHRDLAKRAADLSARLDAEVRDAARPKVGSGGVRTPTGTQPMGGNSDGTAGLTVGSVVHDRYEILGELGRGGMSRVWRALDRVLDEQVAIKTLLRYRDDEAANVDAERLLREVQICRRITHPNVVRVYDLGELANSIFITMELIEGTRLDAVVKEKRQLPLTQVKSILAQTVAGLAAAHDLDIVHRDLKPGNIILSPRGLKILDFGIARQEGRDTRLTSTGEAMGSPMYMSPEQIQGIPLDGRSDLYALGVLTFALLTGREPFHGNTPTAVAVQHLHQDPPDPRGLRPDLPEAWVTFVLRLLEKRPMDRYASAREVAAVVVGLPD